MPIRSYSVLKGRPTSGKVVSGSSAHYQITVAGSSTPLTIAVNIESVDGSEVLYAILRNFTPPSVTDLNALANGIQLLPSQPGTHALDFVREMIAGAPMITRQQMTLLPIAATPNTFSVEFAPAQLTDRDRGAHQLENAVVDLLNQATADPGAMVYAFGSAFADRGVVDGIHNIHMNQGNPAKNHGSDNGIWQDGGLFLRFTAKPEWVALFIAFQTQSWTTDDRGDPV